MEMTASEYKSLGKRKRPNKYGARKTQVGGFTFDSKLESEFYLQLMLWQQTEPKCIQWVDVHPFVCIGQGKAQRICLDFCIWGPPWVDFDLPEVRCVFIDVKSEVTRRKTDFKRVEAAFNERHPARPLWVVTKSNGIWYYNDVVLHLGSILTRLCPVTKKG